MSESTKKADVDLFFASMMQELSEMSDADLLEGEEAQHITARRDAMLERAKKEAGRRRMAAAKSGISQTTQNAATPTLVVTASLARQYLASVANDVRYTLAARNATGLSDAEAIALYLKIKSLEKAAGDKEGGAGS